MIAQLEDRVGRRAPVLLDQAADLLATPLPEQELRQGVTNFVTRGAGLSHQPLEDHLGLAVPAEVADQRAVRARPARTPQAERGLTRDQAAIAAGMSPPACEQTPRR